MAKWSTVDHCEHPSAKDRCWQADGIDWLGLVQANLCKRQRERKKESSRCFSTRDEIHLGGKRRFGKGNCNYHKPFHLAAGKIFT